jgi:TonB family protein
LYLEVGTRGEVEKARVIQSLGLGLDEKAVEAVKQWRFKPGEVNGKPVRVEQSAEVSFVLNPAPSWRVLRAAYRFDGRASEFSKQVFAEYKAPDDKPCLSGGGPVIVSLQIGGQGKPGNIRIEEHGEAASKAVMKDVMKVVPQWRFQPGLVNEEPGILTGTFEMDCHAPPAAGEGGRVFQGGDGAKMPVPIYRPEGDYSEEARKAKLQGTVIIYLQVDTLGHATNMRVVRSLGLGLDEKEMEALNQWRFKPATKNGVPVTHAATIERVFNLPR